MNFEKIKLIVFDVDGSMTNGGVNIDNKHIKSIKSTIKDRLGIVLAQSVGIEFTILTGRSNVCVEQRANKLHIKYIVYGASNKAEYLKNFISSNNLLPEDIAYIGNSFNDLPAMRCAGVSFCPSDAEEEVKAYCDFVLTQKSGKGVVLGFVEKLLEDRKLWETAINNKFPIFYRFLIIYLIKRRIVISKIKRSVSAGKYLISIFLYKFSVKKQMNQKILALKGSHQGQRCFIIGNGPSLKAEDLDKLLLNNEICFASNYISEIFTQTNWRPTYFSVMDIWLQRNIIDVMSKTDAKIKFFSGQNYLWTRKVQGNCIYLNAIGVNAIGSGSFSEDIAVQIHSLGTVTYALIQIAVYMGFKEIYLIGMDNVYAKILDKYGILHENKDVQSHFYSHNDKKLLEPSIPFNVLLSVNSVYEAVKQYADTHNIKVINATRGGQLEVFPRIDFDLIWKTTP